MSYRILWSACAWTTLLVASDSSAGRIGIYHWGGHAPHTMSEGVERIAALGGRVARLAYSARSQSDYINAGACFTDFSLASFAGEPDVRRALDNAAIQTVILTVYDGTTFGDCATHKYMNPRFFTPENTAAVEAEYSEFVLLLFRRYANTGRRFILSNWESDNAVYCGAAYGYTVNPEFRAQCEANYAQSYDGNTSPQQSLEGLRLWFSARQAGIEAGIQRAAAEGLGGLEVIHAPEISIVRSLEENGLPSVLRDVLPRIRPEYVSYSSYESINREDPGAALAADMATIRAASGARGIIIGEAGYARSTWRDAVPRLATTLEAALAAGADYVIYWNLYDQDEANDFGIFDFDGRLTATGEFLQGVLAAREGETVVSKREPSRSSRRRQAR